jgi:hypothetical protein
VTGSIIPVSIISKMRPTSLRIGELEPYFRLLEQAIEQMQVQTGPSAGDLEIGRRLVISAKNNGASVAKGAAVMSDGAQSPDKMLFELAIANGSVEYSRMLGVVTESIGPGGTGEVMTFGVLQGFNATGSPHGQTWAVGDDLYFSPTVPGGWTNIQPVKPAITVPVATVLNATANGSIFVNMRLAGKLADLLDVDMNPPPADRNVLIYNQADSDWEPGQLSLSDMSDVDMTPPPEHRDNFQYNSATGAWEPVASVTVAKGKFIYAK